MDLTGKPAPDFRLEASGGAAVGLSDFRDSRNVLLVFYPLDFSSICSVQIPEFSDRRQDFEALETVVLGVSRDSVQTHRAWSRELGIEVPLLADMTGQAARAYGVWREDEGTSKRATFLVDKGGTVVFQHVEDAAGDFTLRAADVLERLRALAS